MVTSKFGWRAYLMIFISLSLILVLGLYLGLLTTGSIPAQPLGGAPLPIFLGLVLVWLVLGEVRSKLIRVIIDDEGLMVRQFGGFGRVTRYPYSDLDGYKISILIAGGGTYEYLYLLSRGKKVVKLSSQYHKNYLELKSIICANLNDLGIEQFSYLDELKEIFI